MASGKFYVVWKGRRSGIFASWEACSASVSGYRGAEYKSFGTRSEAEAAFRGGYAAVAGTPASSGKWRTARIRPVLPSLCVDAACSGSPGPLEYRAVDTESGRQLFRAGPFRDGTNNVGEFLAIVHALAWLEGHGQNRPVYSDSANAIAWVKAGKCNTKLKRTSGNAILFEHIARAERRLAERVVARKAQPDEGISILKWDTEKWGENPADFGRK